MVQRIKPAEKGEINGTHEVTEGYIGIGKDYTMSFLTKDVTHLVIDGASVGLPDKQPNGKTLIHIEKPFY